MSATIRPVGILKSGRWTNAGREDAPIAVQEGQSIEAACRGLGLPLDLIALFLVNGRPEPKEYVLRTGDEIKLVALVGGGVRRHDAGDCDTRTNLTTEFTESTEKI